jgi:hypothetical protein
MARYAIDLLTNPAKHKLFAEAARNRAIVFESSKIIAQYEQYYERILSGSKAPSK